MAFNIIVCAKQVPDTNVIKINPKTGTLIRDGVPSILNHDDNNALEEALKIKDKYDDVHITVISMGPPQASDLLFECIAKGADEGILVSDRAVGGSDTWATSNTLEAAVRKWVKENGPYDIIFTGRQAIDGDTAQVGPQVAEKLGLNQITYTEEILSCKEGKIVVKRHIDGGVETVESPLPCVLTVNGSAAPCRPRNAKLVMRFKRAKAPMELAPETTFADLPYAEQYEKMPYLKLGQLSCADVNADLQQCGLAGSPTKVKTVQNIVFKAKESKVLTSSDEDVNGLIQELLANHTIG